MSVAGILVVSLLSSCSIASSLRLPVRDTANFVGHDKAAQDQVITALRESVRKIESLSVGSDARFLQEAKFAEMLKKPPFTALMGNIVYHNVMLTAEEMPISSNKFLIENELAGMLFMDQDGACSTTGLPMGSGGLFATLDELDANGQIFLPLGHGKGWNWGNTPKGYLMSYKTLQADSGYLWTFIKDSKGAVVDVKLQSVMGAKGKPGSEMFMRKNFDRAGCSELEAAYGNENVTKIVITPEGMAQCAHWIRYSVDKAGKKNLDYNVFRCVNEKREKIQPYYDHCYLKQAMDGTGGLYFTRE